MSNPGLINTECSVFYIYQIAIHIAIQTVLFNLNKKNKKIKKKEKEKEVEIKDFLKGIYNVTFGKDYLINKKKKTFFFSEIRLLNKKILFWII